MPTCIKCLKEKAREEFTLREGGRRKTACKPCEAARHRARRARDRETDRARSRAYRASRPADIRSAEDEKRFEAFYLRVGGRATHMLNNARARARLHGVEMTLTREWLIERLARGVCEITGLPLVLNAGHGRGHKKNAFSPSLDRRVAGAGYTPDNVRMVCWIYNWARGGFPEEAFDKMCRAYLASKETP